MLLNKVNDTEVLAGQIDATNDTSGLVPVMATPTAVPATAGLVKAAGFVVGAGAVCGAAYAAYKTAGG